MTVEPPPGSRPGAWSRPKPWLPPAADECPVDLTVQRWTERSMRWFLRQFDASVIHRDPVLPNVDFLSTEQYTASLDDVEVLVARLSELMLVDRTAFSLELFDGTADAGAVPDPVVGSRKKRTVGHFSRSGGRMVIALDQQEATDPRHLTAIVVHELCHLRLRGEGRLTGDHSDEERLTDLLTVFFGFGIFTTNAAMRFARKHRDFSVVSRGELDDHDLNAVDHHEGYRTLGYLSSREFGYALACYCWIRGETDPPAWVRHLDPGPRVHLEQGLTYLRNTTRPPRHPTARE